METFYLAIDVGTGSVRAALVDSRGTVRQIAAHEHEQIVPRYGWSKQRPADWWAGAARSIREVLERVPGAAEKVAAVCACGQMHGTVLIDADGQLTRDTAPLWNDKRTFAQVAQFRARHEESSYLHKTANPATPAWPAFKLWWIKEHDPESYDRARTVFMPKDYVNFRLTGERACDWNDASTSFLMDPVTRTWSRDMLDLLGLDASKLAPLDILGQVTKEAAAATGLREGTPVLVGGADYPVSVLGSGVHGAGLASDITGTSSIITVLADTPMLHPEVSNLATCDGAWGRFMLLDSGGDAMRWARRAFHENALSYDAIAQKAASAPVGCEGLFFLPYLTGERLGDHTNSRAVLRHRGQARAGASASRGAGGCRVRRAAAYRADPARRREHRTAGRGERRREGIVVAEHQGEHVSHADSRARASGVRRDGLRDSRRHRARPVRASHRCRERLRGLRTRSAARSARQRHLRPHDADLRAALCERATVLRRSRPARHRLSRIRTMIKAILWDMDGTLADSEALHLSTLVAVLAKHGIEAGEEMHPLIFGKTGREVHALCRERFGLSTDFEAWSAFRAQAYLDGAPHLVPRPGALEVYRAAKRAGIAQGIVSNSVRMLLEVNLRALGLEEPHLVTVSANDVRMGKPSPEPYERAAWLLRVTPDDAVVVEDSPTGARAALAANMRVLAWPLDDAGAALFPAEAQIVRTPRELAAALGLDTSTIPEHDDHA
nr:HAD-IA family hydrolase [Candidatus Burkholderia verschuerenii]